MNDIERRLRAAMLAAVEAAPPGLQARVRARHRRHVRRMTAGWVASLAALSIAIPPTVHYLHAVPASLGQRGSRPTSSTAPTAQTAAPGTVLAGCRSANAGELGAHWQDQAIRLGGSPLWVIQGGYGAPSQNGAAAPDRKLELGVAVIVVAGLRHGSTVIARVPPAGRQYLRFLYGPGDSLAPGTRYTMASGESGVTFVACPAASRYPTRGNPTNYYGGFLTLGVRCAPIDISWTGNRTPVKVDFGTC